MFIKLKLETEVMKMTKTKKCGSCGKIKKLDDFWIRSDNKKPRNTCKDCQRKKAADNKK